MTHSAAAMAASSFSVVARRLRTHPPILCCSSACAAWHGLPATLRDLAQRSLASGELLPLLPAWQAPDGDIFVVWQAQRQLSARITAFVMSLRHYLQSTA